MTVTYEKIKTEENSVVLQLNSSLNQGKFHPNHGLDNLVTYNSKVYLTDVILKPEIVDAHIAEWGTIPSLRTVLEGNLNQALEIYKTAIGLSLEGWENFYRRPSTTDKEHARRIEDFYSSIRFIYGQKYIKVVKGSVHSFIVIDDDTVKGSKGYGYFKRGDILKAASWNAPAKNFPRGNILDSWYRTTWTGAY
tara:strand:+ start:457 stop:1035 length:579 start_codon:yes stop_codon:yes gene_type:complete